MTSSTWDRGEGSRDGGDSSPEGISIDASIPMEDLLLPSCGMICTGGSPGRDPMGPNRLLEKPCTDSPNLGHMD